MLRPDLTIVAVTDAYLRATMTKRDAILGRPLFDVFPDNPADPASRSMENVRRSLERVLKSRVPDTMAVQKYDIRRADDGAFEERYWSPVNSPVLGATGEVDFLIHRVEDVTEFVREKQRSGEAARALEDGLEADVIRRAREVQEANERLEAEKEALARSEEMLRLLIEQVEDYAIFRLDAEGRIASWNLGAERLKGYRAEEVLGRDFSLFFPPEALAAGSPREELERVDREGRVEYEDWRVRKDGSRFLANVVITALRDSQGKLRGFAKITRDVTERFTTAERALRLSEKRFAALADNIAQLAWMADEKGNIVWYNKRWYDYTGTTFEQMQGWGWRSVHHPDHVERVTETWRRALERGQGWEDTFPLRGKDGHFRWFLSRAVAVHDERGNVQLWFGTNTDVTEQREAQEALKEAVQARDVFLSIASHELRTPLTPLTLHLQGIERMLEKEEGKVEPRKIAEKIGKAGKQVAHLERLVNNLLDVSRLTESRLTLTRESVDLGELVAEVVDRMRPDFEQAQSSVSLSASPGVVGSWDRARLEQVVVNLLGNAAKYGRGKPVDVAVRATDGRAFLVVTDRGIGISEVDQKRIFERFERAVSERHYGGFGLGLWISRQVVEALGGTIAVASRLGDGSTFTVVLPLAAPAERADEGGGKDEGDPCPRPS